MSIFNVILLSGVAAAALIAKGNWAYLRWLTAIVAAYVVSVVYWDLGLPYAEAVGFACDAAIVVGVLIAGTKIWEMRLGVLFLASAFVNMAYLAHNLVGAGIFPHAAHATVLEVINVLAIGNIGLTAAFDRAGFRSGRAFDPWLHIFGFVRPAYIKSRARD